MRILVSSVVNQDPEILQQHLRWLLSQKTEAEMEFFYIVDPTAAPEITPMLDTAGVAWEFGDPKDDTMVYGVSEHTHHWEKPTFYWLAQQKQKLFDKCVADNYDGIFIVDSDLLCGPETLQSLLDTGKDVVSAVFWTKWTPQMPPLPQVWMEHPYEMQGRGLEAHEHLDNAAHRRLWKVAGLGACTLLRKDAFPKAKYFPLVKGLPQEGMWQGEDRHFSVNCDRGHVGLWADAWPDVVHVYRPSDKETMDSATSRFQPYRETPELGDAVSVQLSPIEEPGLAGWTLHLRGRLGQLKLLPDVERALEGMKTGEDRFVPVQFPIWWKVPEYRGTTKTLRIKLLGVKPWSYAPGLNQIEQDTEVEFEPYYSE